MSRFKLLVGAAVLSTSTVSMPAHALNFILTPAAGAAGAGVAPGSLARKGFEIAAAYWSSVITNDVTVRLDIGYATLGTGILAQAGSTTAAVYNAPVYSALQASNSGSGVDVSALATLAPLSLSTGGGGLTAQSFLANAQNAAGNGYIDTATRFDNDGSGNNAGIQLNTSVAKALGVTTTFQGAAIDFSVRDAAITFSDAFTFDFDPSDGIASNAYDFIGVAIHEIGHALGFRSGVDTIDAYTSPGGTLTNANLENFVNIATVLDYFRYSSAGVLDRTTQGSAYFSIDGGATQLFGDSRFEMGARNGGRNRQASHFYDVNPQIGIMDPTSGLGQMQDVKALDIAAFDAIGWTMTFDALANSGYKISTRDIYLQSGVPEPMTWMMLIVGFGAIGGAMRRKTNAKVSVSYA